MPSTASPYGLRPVNMIGGQSFTGGTVREYKVAADTTAFYVGSIIVLSSAGLPGIIGSTPVAPKFTSSASDGTVGVVGVCAGVRYTQPGVNYSMHGQYLPANASTAGYTDIWVKVWDDPDQLYQIQGAAALGTFNSGTGGSGWPGAVGKNAAVSSFTGSATTGLSNTALAVGSNGGSIAATTTLGFRIVDLVHGTEGDNYPEFIVKFNAGVHGYYNPLGV